MIDAMRLVVPMAKALNTSKLVKKEVNVTRGGKMFHQMRWVRPAEAEGNSAAKKSANGAWQSASVDWLLDSNSSDNLKQADKKLLVQPTGEIEELYKQAEDMRKPFRAWMEQVKDEVGAAELLSRPVLKSKERVVQKMKADGENDASHIYDIDGHTLVFDDLQGVARALKYFLGHKGTVRIKNNFAHPSALGYRDININIRLPNGMISEIQLNTKAMLEAKEKTAHLFYEVSREAEGQCPPPPPPAPYSDTVEAQRAIYGYSWDWSKNQKGFDEASFNASVFDIARPFWSKSMRVLETDAKWLSDKTRNAFQTFGSKTNGLSSTSKNSKSSLSKSIPGIALPPHSKNSMDRRMFAIGIVKSIDKGKLSRKLVMVSRAGKTYQAVRWVKPGATRDPENNLHHQVENAALAAEQIGDLIEKEEFNTKPLEYSAESIKLVYGSRRAYEKANKQLQLSFFESDEDLYSKPGDVPIPDSGKSEKGRDIGRRNPLVSSILGEANHPVHPAFKENRKGQRRVSFVGQTISGPRDIAELFQVYRNPQIETFHCIYTDDKGKILAHNAMSSGVAGQTIAFQRSPYQGEQWSLSCRMDRLGATKMYILHNHPSGDTEPSKEDIGVTKDYSEMLGGRFAGHIIIDHNKATFISPNAQDIEENFSYTPSANSYDAIPQYAISDYRDAAKYAIDVISVSQKKAALIITDFRHRIIEWRPFTSSKPQDIYQAVKESGGSRAFIATSDRDFFDSVVQNDDIARDKGGKYRVLIDVLLVDREKFLANNVRNISGQDHYSYIFSRRRSSAKKGKYVFESQPHKYGRGKVAAMDTNMVEGSQSYPGGLKGGFSDSTMTSNTDIARLQNMLKDRKWGKRYVGIRVVDDNYDDYNAKVGDILAPSYRWEEGNYTNERLNGTSAISMDAKIDPVSYNGYMGRRIQVIGGDYQEWGEDRGEVVIPDAEVLAVYDLPRETRKSLTFSGYKPQGRSKVGKVRLVVQVCR